MSTFYLVRHGLRISRNEDTLLSPEGIVQAKQTGSFFQNKDISKIIASPTERTLHTAELINACLHVPIVTDDRLRERMEYEPSFGTFDEFLAEWDKTMADRLYRPQIGSSAYQTGERVLQLLSELPEGKYVLVSHGGTIGDVVRNLQEDAELTLMTDHKGLSWLAIPECSITEINVENGHLKVVSIASTTHQNTAI